MPTVFWIDGNTIESSSFDGLAWSAPSAASGVTLGAGTISDLRVSIASTGSGAAVWVRDNAGTFNVDTATIAAGTWSVSDAGLDDCRCLDRRGGRRERQWTFRPRVDRAHGRDAGRDLDG